MMRNIVLPPLLGLWQVGAFRGSFVRRFMGLLALFAVRWGFWGTSSFRESALLTSLWIPLGALVVGSGDGLLGVRALGGWFSSDSGGEDGSLCIPLILKARDMLNMCNENDMKSGKCYIFSTCSCLAILITREMFNMFNISWALRFVNEKQGCTFNISCVLAILL